MATLTITLTLAYDDGLLAETAAKAATIEIEKALEKRGYTLIAVTANKPIKVD